MNLGIEIDQILNYPNARKALEKWERALDIFEKEGEKVLSLARSMEKDKLFERVLVSELFGLEDNSRYYSVAMLIEHLLIVGTALQNRIPLLSQGKSLDKDRRV